MPNSISVFLKLCSPCEGSLSLPAAGSKQVLASSQSQYASRTPREPDEQCRVSGPLHPGLLPIGMMRAASWKEVVLVLWRVYFKYS
jgi:hypothetical protein